MKRNQPVQVAGYGIDKMRIGQRLKELRYQHGFTVEQLAEALCVSANAVYKWESGRTVPTVDNFYLLSCVYHTSIDLLILGNCPATPIEPQLSQAA